MSDPRHVPISFDPARQDFEPYGLTCVSWKPSPMSRPDHHNEVELNFLKSGTVTYLLGGRKVTITAAHLGVFWAAVPHQIIDFGDEPSYFVATIPLPWFLQWQLPDHLVQPLMRGHLIVDPSGDRAAFDGQLFSRWEKDLLPSNSGLEPSVLLEMQARLLRLATSLPPRKFTVTKQKLFRAAGLSKVEQMACFIAQHYLEKLSVERIAKVVDLHPNYAMNLFQKTFGATLVDYITNHRVSHAQRLLVTSTAKIVDVATESGFVSISRFNIAFRKVCGCSPREYRRSHIIKEEDAR
jgi:AraC family transcriptional regulator, melibiose operon regulatory protein